MKWRQHGMRRFHRASGLVGAIGLVLLTVTGLGLLHPTWFGRGSEAAWVVAADPFSPGRMLRAAPFLLEESHDGGTVWRDLPARMMPASPVVCVFAAADSGTVWLLGTTELLVSRDGGRVWTEVVLPVEVSFDETARGLALLDAAAPVLTTAHHGWRHEPADSAWRELWHRPPTRADHVRRWMHRLHSGHWGPPVIARLHDAVAVLVLAVIITGLCFFRRRQRGSRA